MKKYDNCYLVSLVLIFLIIVIICSMVYIYNIYTGNKNKSLYKNIDNHISHEKNSNMEKVKKLKEENKDVIGWIQIENTIIDYPILKSEGNNYYLTHNYKNQKSKYGSIFVKNECNIQDNNSNVIIYGHNMKDGQMFTLLQKYADINFYNKHKIIKVVTDVEESDYIIMFVFKSRIFYQDEKNVFRFYNYTNFENEEQYNEFLDNCKKIKLYDTGVSAKYGEQLITLITCEYSQENGRMVVVAKKIS